MKYKSGSAFRTALVENLRHRADAKVGRDVTALLKIVAAERFMARLVDSNGLEWVLKGGMNLLARLGPTARTTRDADIATQIAREAAIASVQKAAERDVGDYLQYRVAEPVALDADGEDGGLRFNVTCVLDGKELAKFNVDVVLNAPPATDVDIVTMPNLLEFAEIPSVEIRAISPTRQIVEKMHAYTRDYGQENTRPRDLADMLALAGAFSFKAASLRDTVVRVFEERGRQKWPPRIIAPPDSWNSYWTAQRGTPFVPDVPLDEAFTLLVRFWSPVIESDQELTWQPAEGSWSSSV